MATNPIVDPSDPAITRQVERQINQAVTSGSPVVSEDEAVFLRSTATVSGNDVIINRSQSNDLGDTVSVVSGRNISVTAIDQTINRYTSIDSGVSEVIAGNGISVSNPTGQVTVSLDASNLSVGFANVAGVANSVAAANVSGLGNVATINLDGNALNVLHGDGSWSADVTDYSNANVVLLLDTFGSNTINTTGNVSVGKLETDTVEPTSNSFRVGTANVNFSVSNDNAFFLNNKESVLQEFFTGDWSSAVWTAPGNVTIETSNTESIYLVSLLDRLVSYFSGDNNPEVVAISNLSLTVNGTSVPVSNVINTGVGTWVIIGDQSPVTDPTTVTELAFNYDYNSGITFKHDSDDYAIVLDDENFRINTRRDIRLESGDDIRLEAKSNFTLRNFDDIDIATDWGNSDHTWRFRQDGNLEFPDNSIMNTAPEFGAFQFANTSELVMTAGRSSLDLVNISTLDGTTKVWEFVSDGSLTFPEHSTYTDGTIFSPVGAGLRLDSQANITLTNNTNIVGNITANNLGNIASIDLDGNSANYLDGTGTWGPLSVTLSGDGGNISNIQGANVSGEVSFAATANAVALGNVSGAGNIASINLDGNVSNVLRGDGTFAADSEGSYGDSNVVSLLNAFGSNTITTTGLITGDGGGLSNVPYANVTGTPTLGNIASINLDGNVSNVLRGDGTFAADANSSYGDSNVVSLLGSFGSNTITTTGNVSVGNITVTTTVNTGKSFLNKLTTGISSANPMIDCSTTQVIAVSTVTSDFTPNLTNLDLSQNKYAEVSFIVVQDASPNKITGIEIEGTPITQLYWKGGVEPTGTSNSIDIWKFTIFRESVGDFASQFFIMGERETYQ